MKSSLIIITLLTTSILSAGETKREVKVPLEPYKAVLYHRKINGVYVTTIHVDGVEVSREVEEVQTSWFSEKLKKLRGCRKG